MRSRIEAFLSAQTQLLADGDVEALAKLFRTPLPVYHPDGLKLDASSVEVRKAMETMVAIVQSIAVAEITYQIHEVSERDGTGTVAALLDFDYLDANGDLLEQSKLWYYFEPTEGGLRIVMVEYLKTAFSQILRQITDVRQT